MNETKPEPIQWPPPRASRAVRRACKPHAVKGGYCAICGTKVSK